MAKCGTALPLVRNNADGKCEADKMNDSGDMRDTDGHRCLEFIRLDLIDNMHYDTNVKSNTWALIGCNM